MLDQTFHTPLPLELDVAIPSGNVELETADGDESRVTVDSGDERLLDDMEIRLDGNRLVVAFRGKRKLGGLQISVGSFTFGHDALRVTARVPHGTALKIKSPSADTTARGRLSSLDVNTTSGDTRIDGDIDGNVKIKTISGDARLDRVGGDIGVETVSGDVRVGPVAGSVETKTISGDIRFDSIRAGDMRFSSVSGDVEIGIAAGSLVDVDAGSTSGDLSSEVALGSDPAAGGSDGPTVVVRGRTISGDVRVFRAA